MTKLWENTFNFEGSTRSAACIRIGLVFLIWSRWAGEWLPFRPMVFTHFDMHLLGAMFFLFSFLMFIGKWTRFSTFCTGVTLLFFYYYVGFSRGHFEYTHHHTYLLAFSTFLLSFTDCGASFSCDRYDAIQKALKNNLPIPEEKGALWGMRLIALQLTMVYLASAYNKTNNAFLSGERLEHMAMYWYLGSDYPPFPGFQAVMFLFAATTVILEYSLAFGLWFPKIQKPLMLFGIVFHLILYCFLPVRTFSLTMCLLYLAFVPPEKIHEWFDLMLLGKKSICEK